MFSQSSFGPKRKRSRDSDDESSTQGFSEHRTTKRRVSSLAFRQSPEVKRRFLSTFPVQEQAPQSPTLADITPVGSDTEDNPKINEPKSFFSPWSSSPELSTLPSSQASPCPGSSQSAQMQDAPVYSDDLEMTDTGLLYPGPFHADPATSINGRIPTPITCQFSSHIRSVDKAPSVHEYYKRNVSDSFADDEAMADPTRQGRRLPSPISEDESSPSLVLGGLGEMQMDVETTEEPKETPKKGHMRSKHSLRDWGGLASQANGGSGVKRFSMGYRSDCEKCQNKVPGHFSHIITY